MECSGAPGPPFVWIQTLSALKGVGLLFPWDDNIRSACIHCTPWSTGSDARQVLTGKLPFHDVKTDAVIMLIVRGTRPERPRLSHAIGFTDPVWAVVEGCWKEHHSFRPDVRTVVRCLTTAAAQWTPTPPLSDDLSTDDESESFSMMTTLFDSSRNAHLSGKHLQALVIQQRVSTHGSNPGSVTRRDEKLECDEEGEENRTVVPPHDKNTVPENLHELADRFYGYYQRSCKIEDLDWVIKHVHKATTMYPHPLHPGRLRSLTRLAGHYYERHEISRDPGDIEISIEKGSDVERRTTPDDKIRPDALLILAKAQYVSYNRNHPQGSLEAVIKYSSEAVKLYPSDNPFRAETLMVFSAALFDRYQLSLGRSDSQPQHSDLDNAISNSTVAVDLFPPGDPILPNSRLKLSTFLFARYQRRKSLGDLQQSVYHARLASVDLIPDERPGSLIYLGQLLTHLSHDSQTLTELAKCGREALDLLPPGDDRCAGAIHNLVTASHRMYVTINSAAHLDKAIDYNRQLLRLLPCGSGPRYSQLRLHHNLLEYRLSEGQQGTDLAEMADTTREIAAADSQSYYDHYYSAQPSTPPPSTTDTPPGGPSATRPFEYRPPQHWSPRPYYYDDSAVSVAGSASTTSSAETGDYGSGSDSSLVAHAVNLSFIEPGLDRVFPQN